MNRLVRQGCSLNAKAKSKRISQQVKKFFNQIRAASKGENSLSNIVTLSQKDVENSSGVSETGFLRIDVPAG